MAEAVGDQVVLETIEIQEELQVETQPPAKKPRVRLLKKDIQAICKGMLLIKPVEVLPTVISSVEADATHLQAFPKREKLWKHVKASEALPDLVRQLIVGYVNVYKTHHKGKDKYAHFLVAWHEFFSRFAVEGSDPENAIWCALVSGGDDYLRDTGDRSAIMTSIAKAVYELLTEKASQLQEQRKGPAHTDSRYPQAKEALPDDDASIIRVSGFALHSAIRFGRKALLPKNKSKHTTVARQKFTKELELLKLMKTADKSFMPRVVTYQDRGHMTIMHPAMLDFGRTLFSTVRLSLNYTNYMKKGPEVFKHTHDHVLQDSELLQKFKSCLENIPHSSTQGPASDVEEAVVSKVYITLVTKMLHTINNDFLKNLSLLDKIATGKGTGAKLLLRDKLKATAADTHSRVPKI